MQIGANLANPPLMRLDGEVVEDAHVGAALAQWAARVTEQPHEQTDVAEWNAVRSPVQTRATLVTVRFGCALRIAALNPAWPACHAKVLHGSVATLSSQQIAGA